MTEKSKKWSDENVATLNSIVGDTSPVTVELVELAATTLGFTTRSIASKLRKLEREVASMAKEKSAAFTASEGEDLAAFVKRNAGNLNYKEIAENFAGGKFNHKQIQGKILALELTASVKPTDKAEAVRVYSEAEEAKFVQMANDGAFIEDIAKALGKEIASIRGKALSLTRSGLISNIPTQRESTAKHDVDPIAALGDKLGTMTVEAIAVAVQKTERGIRTLLTRRGLDCADYKGAAKKAKAEAKAA